MFNYFNIPENDTYTFSEINKVLDNRKEGDYSNWFFDIKVQNYKTDVYKIDDGYCLEMDIPGYNKENIDIDFHKGILTIEGKIEEKENEDSDKKYLIKERKIESFLRKWKIENASEDGLKASYKDGILKVFIPFKKESEPIKNKIKID